MLHGFPLFRPGASISLPSDKQRHRNPLSKMPDMQMRMGIGVALGAGIGMLLMIFTGEGQPKVK